MRYTNSPGRERFHYRGPEGETGEIVFRPRLYSSNGDFLADAAVRGLGVVVEPTFIVYQQIDSGELEPVLLDHSWADIALYVLYPPTRHISARVRAFVDRLATAFGGRPYWEKCLEQCRRADR